MARKEQCRCCLKYLSVYQVYRNHRLNQPLLCPECEKEGREPIDLSLMDSKEDFSKKYDAWLDVLLKGE